MQSFTFSWIDIALISVIVISALFGMRRGLIGEVISLTSWVLGAMCAILWGKDLGQFIFQNQALQDLPWLPNVLGSTLILIAILVVGALILSLIKPTVEKIQMEGIDRSLGLLFGAIRGCFFIIAVGIITNISQTAPTVWNDSSLLRFLMGFEPFVQDLYQLIVDWFNQNSSSVQ